MIKILVKFWPSTIPILLYILWFAFFRKKKDDAIPVWEAKLWIWTLVVSLIIAVICIAVMAFNTDSNRGSIYIPPTYQNGKIVHSYMM